MKRVILTVALATVAAVLIHAQQKPQPFVPVSEEMLLKPSPNDWLMYSRTYDAQRFSPLNQITTKNVGQLKEVFKQELPAGDLIRELLEWFIGDVVDELGSRAEVEYAYRILSEGSSADRQLATYRRTGDLKAVVDQLIAETEEGVVAGGTPKAEGALA